MFQNVPFFNISVFDVPPRPGEFGEIVLFFLHVSFKNWPIASHAQIHLHNTFKGLVSFQECLLHSVNFTVIGSYLWLTVKHVSVSNSNLSVHLARISRTEILSSKFQNSNITDNSHSVLAIKAELLTLVMLNSTVTNNQGGIALFKPVSFISSWMQVTIQSCRFGHNHNMNSGGALSVEYGESSEKKHPSYLQIVTSNFVGNSAARKDFRRAFGGAISLKSTSLETIEAKDQSILHVSVSKTMFVNNIAEDGGGAISASGQGIKMSLLSCTFFFNDSASSSLKIPFVLASSQFTVEDSEFMFSVPKFDKPIVELQMVSATSEIVVSHVHIACLPWRNLEIDSDFGVFKSRRSILQKFILRCTSCFASYYVLSDGKFNVSYISNHTSLSVSMRNRDYEHLKCEVCPSGAECPGDNLLAKSNFWGYETENSFVFEQCPVGYCFEPMNNKHSFDQCANHRTGVLCGVCQEKFSLSMMSNKCIKNEDCHKTWGFVALLVGAILYMLWYTFKEYTYQVPVVISQSLSKICWCSGGDHSQGRMCYVDKGYFGILTYFVQTVAVLRLHLHVQSDSSLLDVMKHVEMYIGLLLSVELTNAPADICMIKNGTMTHQVMGKSLFLVSIFVSWLITYVVFSLTKMFLAKLVCWTPPLLSTVHDTLINGFVKIVKYTYAGFSQMLFFSLTCITISGRYVWLHDGSVQCFSLWQKSVLLLGAYFIVPFLLTLCLGMTLLKRKSISWLHFTIGIFVQGPFLICWFLMIKKKGGTMFTQQVDVDKIVRKVAWKWKVKTFPKKILESQTTGCVFIFSEEKKMFNRFKRGFKEEGSAQYWECIVMFRRLLISSTILIPNSIIKESVGCIFCILSLIHHTSKQPFINTFSNKVETLSLTFLCGVAMINLIKSFYIQEGMTPVGTAEQIVKSISLIETLFLPLLLFFIALWEIISSFKHRKHE